MKKVIELGQLVEVADDAQKCSVCKKFKSKSEFMNPRPRTNCEGCYNMPHEKWDETTKAAEKAEKELSLEAKRFIAENAIKDVSVSVEDMIKALKKLPPGSRLVVTQRGYYAEGSYADIFFPEKIRDDDMNEFNVYKIGHSHQS